MSEQAQPAAGAEQAGWRGSMPLVVVIVALIVLAAEGAVLTVALTRSNSSSSAPSSLPPLAVVPKLKPTAPPPPTNHRPVSKPGSRPRAKPAAPLRTTYFGRGRAAVGKPLVAKLAVSTHAPGTVRCSARASGRPLAATGTFSGGVAVCNWAVPAAAAGSRVTGTVAVSVGKRSARRTFSVTVLAPPPHVQQLPPPPPRSPQPPPPPPPAPTQTAPVPA